MDDQKTVREYKDTVFTKLFGEKKNLLELYNAIENTSYGMDTEIKITTLENVLFWGLRNDLSFTMDGKRIVLIEHQSTINYNLPLRMLMYISDSYKRETKEEDIYRKGAIPLPAPEFIVLYNGEAEFPDRATMKLSDMYIKPSDGGSLELAVKVININKGRNEDIAKRSKALNSYNIFIYLIKEYTKAMNGDRDSAIAKAMDDCIRQDVLKDFLEKHGSEVRNMLMAEFNMDTAKRVWQEEAREDGIAIGEAKGIAIGEARGKSEGIAEERTYVKSLIAQGLTMEELLEKLQQ